MKKKTRKKLMWIIIPLLVIGLLFLGYNIIQQTTYPDSNENIGHITIGGDNWDGHDFTLELEKTSFNPLKDLLRS